MNSNHFIKIQKLDYHQSLNSSQKIQAKNQEIEEKTKSSKTHYYQATRFQSTVYLVCNYFSMESDRRRSENQKKESQETEYTKICYYYEFF